MRVAVACDHAGLPLKQGVVEWLGRRGHEVVDLGTDSAASVDYPDYAERATDQIVTGCCQTGVLVCGTGIGMSMAANKVPGIRAAVATDPYMARMARAHNDANVLCLGSRVLGEGLAEEIVDAWLSTAFLGGRHAQRVEKMGVIERRGR